MLCSGPERGAVRATDRRRDREETRPTEDMTASDYGHMVHAADAIVASRTCLSLLLRTRGEAVTRVVQLLYERPTGDTAGKGQLDTTGTVEGSTAGWWCVDDTPASAGVGEER
jgi:hypothetical protein